MAADSTNDKISVTKEKLVIGTHDVVTGEVSVSTVTESETVEVPLTSLATTYTQERIIKNEVVEQMPQVRQEGDQIIIPVVKEEQVVTTRLVLVEEIRLTKKVTKSERTENITLHSERVSIDRK